jgi:hypothetical protein
VGAGSGGQGPVSRNWYREKPTRISNTLVTRKNVLKSSRLVVANSSQPATAAAPKPIRSPTMVAPAVVVRAAAIRNSASSIPSRRTATKASEKSAHPPRADDGSRTSRSRSTWIARPCRPIQKIIHVSTAAARSMAVPSKICSAWPSNDIPSATNPTPPARLRIAATPASIHTKRAWSAR